MPRLTTRLILLAATLGSLTSAFSTEQPNSSNDQVTTAAPATSTGEYILKGFFGKDAEAEASIQSIKSGKSFWIRQGEAKEGIKIVSIDSKSGTVIIEINNIRKNFHYREGQYDVPNSKEAIQEKVKRFNLALAAIKKNLLASG